MSDVPQLRPREKRFLYGVASVTAGTVQIQGVPTCTLYDDNDAANAGMDGVTADGQDTTPGLSVRAWKQVDVELLGLGAGLYTLVFRFLVAKSDGSTEVVEPAVRFQVIRPG